MSWHPVVDVDCMVTQQGCIFAKRNASDLLLIFAGHGTPRDLTDMAVDALLTMTSQPGVLRQDAVLAGIAAVKQANSKQVSTVMQVLHDMQRS